MISARTKSSASVISSGPLMIQPKAPSGPCAASSTTERSKFGSDSGGAATSRPGARLDMIQLETSSPAPARRVSRVTQLDGDVCARSYSVDDEAGVAHDLL